MVPRTRFAPVKTTSDLLVLRSDAYVLTDDLRVEPSPDLSDGLPLVELDSDYYKLLRDFDARFPAGPPSLVGATKLAVEGDVKIGADVVAACFVIDLPELGGAEKLRAMGVAVNTLMAFEGH